MSTQQQEEDTQATTLEENDMEVIMKKSSDQQLSFNVRNNKEALEIAKQILLEQDSEQFDEDGYNIHDPYASAAKKIDEKERKKKQQEEAE